MFIKTLLHMYFKRGPVKWVKSLAYIYFGFISGVYNSFLEGNWAGQSIYQWLRDSESEKYNYNVEVSISYLGLWNSWKQCFWNKGWWGSRGSSSIPSVLHGQLQLPSQSDSHDQIWQEHGHAGIQGYQEGWRAIYLLHRNQARSVKLWFSLFW